jgi:hypothetical protein
VRVCERRHPSEETDPRAEVIAGEPQASVAVAAPGAGTPVGLHPRLDPEGQKVKTGGAVSAVHVNTCVQVEVLPHPSVAVYVRVCERIHPSEDTEPRADVIDGVLQASVAVAAPGAGTPAGLHPKLEPEGQNVNVGGTKSEVQVNSCVQVDVLPHPSVAV